ncbi:MAG: hypothetical protein OXC93_02275, partial [Rhodospirillaceae bacterium]|nr:hypothetical protein [Rhodospirillaceae bacterium]
MVWRPYSQAQWRRFLEVRRRVDEEAATLLLRVGRHQLRAPLAADTVQVSPSGVVRECGIMTDKNASFRPIETAPEWSPEVFDTC